MLIVPELQVTFIFPPRTGSDSLCVELMGRFPNAFLPYRHMEADGLPAGYETWRKVGFVRHPLARLWSIFKCCAILPTWPVVDTYKAEAERVAKSVEGKSFEQWALTNTELFLPQTTATPVFHQLHPQPENQKSQEIYLRPDLGTVILKFQDLRKHMADWGLNPERRNGATPSPGLPKMTRKLKKHLEKHFAWEMAMDLEAV